MSNLPLLLFPSYTISKRTKQNPFHPNVNLPSHSQQVNRLTPLFQQFSNSLNAKRLQIQSNTNGNTPEMVLVLEVVGTINDFINAVNRINGLEWLGEFVIEGMNQSDGFSISNNPGQDLSGKLYLTMTNQRALNELLSIWQKFTSNPNVKLERGLGKFKELFKHLKTIRKWDIQDRLHETGVLEAWNEDLEHNPNMMLNFEIEMWFRQNTQTRNSAENEIKNIIQAKNGRVISSCVISDIAYHGLLIELPIAAIQEIIDHRDVQLVSSDSIKFLRPVGQTLISTVDENHVEEIESVNSTPREVSDADPIIGLLDGLPLSNHSLLENYLIIDDPDNFEELYLASERRHGTAMASLIINGDANDNNKALSKKIYVRPILTPVRGFRDPKVEGFPNDQLIIDLIHRSVKRMFEGEQNQEAAAPTVRIINLSIGDITRQFYGTMSPLAKLIDWLSYKYNVLFIISAGNLANDIKIKTNRGQFENLSTDEQRKLILDSVCKEYKNRKILSPSESINSITVGAIHTDQCHQTIPHGNDIINPIEDGFPSLISAFGSGYRNSIKPDLIFDGGKQFFQIQIQSRTPTILSVVNQGRLPGIKVATPRDSSINSTINTRGTSNATALVTRCAFLCYEKLLSILQGKNEHLNEPKYEIPLLKAMLIHSASWNDIYPKLKIALENTQYWSDIKKEVESSYEDSGTINREYNRKIKNFISNWIGYGQFQMNRVIECLPNRVTMLGFGTIKKDEGHIYEFPLPPSLASIIDLRKLTITLAYLTPAFSTSQRYRAAKLWFEYDNMLANHRVQSDANRIKNGTVHHDIFDGESAIPFIDGETLKIKINCSKDAQDFSEINYGIFITLEISDSSHINIYEEVKARIRNQIPISSQA